MGELDLLMEEVAIPVSNIDYWKDYKVPDFVEHTYRIDIMFRGLVYKFLDLVQSVGYVYNYDTVPEIVESCREYRNRFILLKNDGDYILCLFKVVDPLGGDKRYVSLYRPISLRRNTDSELEVIRKFGEVRCVKGVICISEQYDSSYYSDNYFNTLESYQQLLKDKGTRFRKVASLENLVTCRKERYCDDLLLHNIEFLNKKWESVKVGQHCNNRADLRMAKTINSGDGLEVMTYWYQDSIIAYQLLVHTGNRHLTIYACKSISAWPLEEVQEYLSCSKEIANLVKRNIVRYTDYRLFEDCLVSGEYDAVYDLSDRKLKGMIEAKRSIFNRCIYYTRMPVSEYLEKERGVGVV